MGSFTMSTSCTHVLSIANFQDKHLHLTGAADRLESAAESSSSQGKFCCYCCCEADLLLGPQTLFPL
ncbi:hypothetical protein OPV22_018504 [Ensete ventricosum]|uniref:Uncharacterized protein n=1 Tax=Ensete ventricosum TaxID=4639 RepID=A0AAV8R0D3_ENSVE|nr:hypothetical protein OPV22_018504 [Ensete ventricosum]